VSETVIMWTAIDQIGRPSRRQIIREGGETVWAIIPSLWDQSTDALNRGSEAGSGGSSPLRERSPADLDLMEIRCLIRDTVRHELALRGRRVRHHAGGCPRPFDADDELRGLASLVLQRNPDEVWWWEYRFVSWARLLEGYLQAVERTARSVYLRNSPCPTCRTKQVTLEREGERVVVPAIVVDFRDGYIRAAVCQACGDTRWRGPDLERLAADLGVAPWGHADAS
jgi:hypothetical protein